MRLRGWRKFAFYAVGSLLLVWTIFPVYYMITLSLVPEEDLFKPRLYVAQPTLENYRQTTQQSNFRFPQLSKRSGSKQTGKPDSF